jgi:hypothetical protein
MKILPLLERQIDTRIDSKQFHGKLKAAVGRQTTSFSKGREHKTDPHMFQKYGHTPLRPGHVDGYDVFIRYLIDHDIDNPHFPRVYNVKRITDKQGRHITKYDVEKLLPYQKLSPEELIRVMQHTFELDYNEKLLLNDTIEDMRHDERYGSSIRKTKEKQEVLARQMSGLLDINDTSNIRLDSLKEAVEMILKIQKEMELMEDLHLDNIMYRRTGQGIQFVLNDPFSYSRAPIKVQ